MNATGTETTTPELTGLDRYLTFDNGDGTFSVRDLVTWQWLTWTNGKEDFTAEEAHDLRMEYAYS